MCAGSGVCASRMPGSMRSMSTDADVEVTTVAINVTVPATLRWTDTPRGAASALFTPHHTPRRPTAAWQPPRSRGLRSPDRCHLCILRPPGRARAGHPHPLRSPTIHSARHFGASSTDVSVPRPSATAGSPCRCRGEIYLRVGMTGLTESVDRGGSLTEQGPGQYLRPTPRAGLGSVAPPRPCTSPRP